MTFRQNPDMIFLAVGLDVPLLIKPHPGLQVHAKLVKSKKVMYKLRPGGGKRANQRGQAAVLFHVPRRALAASQKRNQKCSGPMDEQAAADL